LAIRRGKGKFISSFFIIDRLPNCVGIIDGMLVFMTEAPEW
jgi:hypothetical protein